MIREESTQAKDKDLIYMRSYLFYISNLIIVPIVLYNDIYYIFYLYKIKFLIYPV